MSEIGAILDAARDTPTTENLERMWRAVFALPAWYFVPAQSEGPTTPVALQVDGGWWLPVFTHFRALNEFARQNELRTDQGEVPLLALPPRQALEHWREVSANLEGVLFNASTKWTFRAPREAFDEIAGRLVG